MNKLVIGIFAHVDAGKTTLSEGILYCAGQLRRLGRVDRGDAFLDTHSLQRARGITIFSQQARFTLGDIQVTLVDTPGHVDFSAAAERTMPVLDYGLLVISGTDGVQAHTRTLWNLLRRYRVPTVVFVNKMDLPGPGQAALMGELQAQLSAGCVNFSQPAEKIREEAALCSEEVLDAYVETGTLPDNTLARLTAEGKLIPCFFGAALSLTGVPELLAGLQTLLIPPQYPGEFAARVFQIAPQRMAHVKITGGSLKVRTPLTYLAQDGQPVTEKIKEIRLYDGAKFTQAEEVEAGQVCTLVGLTQLRAGQGLGAEPAGMAPALEPVMTFRLTPGEDPALALPKLRELEREDPQLHIVWDARLGEIHARLMGQVQIEVLQALAMERYGMTLEVDQGRVLYKETIAAPVEGVGHYEPLRHYAEVHLLMEPLPRSSGLEFASRCPEDCLDRAWQRLILTHLGEKTHLGVATGSPITDMRITLVSGRGHLKHTEGGDFRQATYRAVRQGLMQAQTVILEPYYAFRLAVPPANAGRAMADMQLVGQDVEQSQAGEMTVLTGTAPVASLSGYAAQVAAYTRGEGVLSLRPAGYAPCRDPAAVIAAAAYDPEADLDNTPDSVFCAHGAGFTVKWRDVPRYMHLEPVLRTKAPPIPPPPQLVADLERIMEREFGPIKRPAYAMPRVTAEALPKDPAPARKEYLIIDGYNVLFAWPELSQLAKEDLEAARNRLLDILSNYSAFVRREVIVVFDGYRVKGSRGGRQWHHQLPVVFTRENETADAYIEALVRAIGQNSRVWVATSDSLVQLSAFRSGVLRLPAQALQGEVNQARQDMADWLKRADTQEKRKEQEERKAQWSKIFQRLNLPES